MGLRAKIPLRTILWLNFDAIFKAYSKLPPAKIRSNNSLSIILSALRMIHRSYKPRLGQKRDRLKLKKDELKRKNMGYKNRLKMSSEIRLKPYCVKLYGKWVNFELIRTNIAQAKYYLSSFIYSPLGASCP